MEQDQEPLVFPFNVVKMGKDLFERFKKVPALTIPAGAAIAGLVFYLLLVFLLDTCLVTIVPPFLMLGTFWMLGIKKARMLLVAGAVACAVLLFVHTAFLTDVYTSVEPVNAYSDDAAMVLRNGTVNPIRGDGLTVFNYTLDVYANESTPVQSVSVLIVGVNSLRNESMLPMTRGDNETYIRYYYATTVSDPINQFVFWANVSGTWHLASEYVDGTWTGALGPIDSSSWDVAKPLLYYSAMLAFLQFFLIYALLVAMIWWTRRARRMRVQSMEKWEVKQKEAAAATPKDDAKVPSLSKAMGLEADDSFVCSECGADVPAEAKECPKCGEKFE